MRYLLDKLIGEFGFRTSLEFANSTFGFTANKPILLISFSLGFIGTAIENFLGLDPMVYIAFILLLFLEFFTGIKASVREGRKIRSKKFGRVILKLLIYTMIIGIVNIFRVKLTVPKAFGVEVNIYSLIYYSSLNLIIFQLILSVFENLARLGFKESSRIFLFLTSKFDKWFDFSNQNEIKAKEKDIKENENEI